MGAHLEFSYQRRPHTVEICQLISLGDKQVHSLKMGDTIPFCIASALRISLITLLSQLIA